MQKPKLRINIMDYPITVIDHEPSESAEIDFIQMIHYAGNPRFSIHKELILNETDRIEALRAAGRQDTEVQTCPSRKNPEVPNGHRRRSTGSR